MSNKSDGHCQGQNLGTAASSVPGSFRPTVRRMRRSLSGTILGHTQLSLLLSGSPSEPLRNCSSQGRSPSAIATGRLPVDASSARRDALSPNVAAVVEDSWTRDTGMEPSRCTWPTCRMTHRKLSTTCCIGRGACAWRPQHHSNPLPQAKLMDYL